MIVVIEKHQKNNDFIQVKPLFAVDEFSNVVTFWRYALFEVILTSAGFSLQLCFVTSHLLEQKYQTPNYEGHLESS